MNVEIKNCKELISSGTKSKVTRQIRKTMKRLKNMGINAKVIMEENRAFIMIEISDLAKLIDRKVTYPLHKTYITDDKIVVEVWKE